MFRPGEGALDYLEVGYDERPTQPGDKRQPARFHKEFSFKQEISSPNRINLLRFS